MPFREPLALGSMIARLDGPRVVCEGPVPRGTTPFVAVHVGDGLRYVPLSGRRRASHVRNSTGEQVPSSVVEELLAPAMRPGLDAVMGAACVAAWVLCTTAMCGLGPVGMLVGTLGMLATPVLAGGLWLARPRHVAPAGLFYRLSTPVERAWDEVYRAWDELAQPLLAGRARPAPSRKWHAGCGHAYDVCEVEAEVDVPPMVCNAEGLWLATPQGRVWLLPDGIYRWRYGDVSLVPWSVVDLAVAVYDVPLADAPEGARKLREAWVHSNLDGTPDQRFVDNERVGIYRFTGLRFSDEDGGLEVLVLCGDGEAVRKLRLALLAYLGCALAVGEGERRGRQ